MQKAEALVRLLSSPKPRIRTGILELPPALIGQEAHIAVRLKAGHQDFRAWKLERVPEGRKSLTLTWETLVDDLRQVIAKPGIPGYCVLVSNLDILLAALRYSERERFWDFIRCTFRYPRGLLLSLPGQAPHLLPHNERQCWLECHRLAALEGEVAYEHTAG